MPGEKWAEPDLSDLRHDLLGVVQTLMGAVELLLTTRLTARQRRYVNVCKRSSEHLIALSRKVPTSCDEQRFNRLAIDDLAELGVIYLEKPVTRGQLIEAVKSAGGGKRLRVLAADDSPDSCALIARFLKGAARRVDIVNDGLSAVEKYQQSAYDLVIMDLDMPVMDGRTAIREIRGLENNHKKQHVPIIVLTSHDLIGPEAGCEPGDSDADESEILVAPAAAVAAQVPGYLSARRNDVRTILRAMTDLNYDAISRVGHALKGTGRSFGFDAIGTIGGRLEEGAGRQDFNQIRAAVSELSNYLDRVRIAVARDKGTVEPIPASAL